ncbi:hypothetical protein L1987_19147 [Smallanthus sonchifolius]|uniref:Uncharacterized protein n=1 Tax=Smallanthus sonchifolius TaxID=185202 RepID=A0ACB9J379_9ASTR|nr:hypothetical protein L1987_19147 [Smallanthus sonchifolius]
MAMAVEKVRLLPVVFSNKNFLLIEVHANRHQRVENEKTIDIGKRTFISMNNIWDEIDVWKQRKGRFPQRHISFEILLTQKEIRAGRSDLKAINGC